MESGPTPHLEGVYGDYAPTVLLPGDPKRARFIAENYPVSYTHLTLPTKA